MLYRRCPGFFERVTAYRLVADPELSAATGMSGPAIEFFEEVAR